MWENKAHFDNLYGYKENAPFKTKIGLSHLYENWSLSYSLAICLD